MSMREEQRLIAALRREVVALEEKLEEKDALLALRFKELATLTAKLEKQQAQLTKLKESSSLFGGFIKKLSPARAPNPFPVAPGYVRFLRKAKRRMPRRAVDRISESRLFDANWYLAQHPELANNAQAKSNPALHYLQEGAKQGLDPGPDFVTNWYLAKNPDVKASGVNPLLHYILHGMEEGRSPKPKE